MFKKISVVILLVLISAFSFTDDVSASSITVSTTSGAVLDTRVNENDTDRNYGSSQEVFVTSYNRILPNGNNDFQNNKSFFQFDLPILPYGSIIESAKVNLFVHDTTSLERTYDIFRVLNSWIEGNGGQDDNPLGELVFDNQPSIADIKTSSTTTPPSNNQNMIFDVTSDVLDFYAGAKTNYGWQIKDSQENSTTKYEAKFRTREYSTVSRRPKLEIVYKQVDLGNIKVVVNSNPSDVSDTFSFSLSASSSPNLSSGQNFTWLGLIPGTYSLEQNIPKGFVQSSVTCSNDSNIEETFEPGSIVIDSGTSITCVFENTKLAYIKISKSTIPDGDEERFEFTGDLNTNDLNDELGISDGEYIETFVLPGTYYTTETLKEGFDLTAISCRESKTQNSGGDFMATTTATLVAEAGENIECVFENTKRSEISVLNITDPNIGNFSFKLESTATTTILQKDILGNGSVIFDNLVPGPYNLSQILPLDFNGEVSSECVYEDGETFNPQTTSISLLPGSVVDCSFNSSKYSFISGKVFNDKDANGIREKGEGYLKDWEISLYKKVEIIDEDGDDEEILDEEEEKVKEKKFSFDFVKSVVSTTKGFIFDNLTPGVYKICQSTKTGWLQTKPSDTTCENGSFGYEIEVLAGEQKTLNDFGNFKFGKATGVVFEDKNFNEIKDKGEKGIADVNVFLKNTNGDILKTVVTDKSGRYLFEELNYGDFNIFSDDISGFLQTVPDDHYSISVISRKVFTKKHFGFYKDVVAPNTPVISSPKTTKEVKTTNLKFVWEEVLDIASPVSYYYQYALSNSTTTNNAFLNPLFTSEKIITNFSIPTGLLEQKYFWNVKACDSLDNCSQYADSEAFVLDDTKPVSVFSSPNENSVFDSTIFIAGTTTDSNTVASTTIQYAVYTESESGGLCGKYTDLVTLINPVASSSFAWSYNWIPNLEDDYCITAHGEDLAGNIEQSPVIKKIKFKKTTTVAPTPTTQASSGNGPIAIATVAPQVPTASSSSNPPSSSGTSSGNNVNTQSGTGSTVGSGNSSQSQTDGQIGGGNQLTQNSGLGVGTSNNSQEVAVIPENNPENIIEEDNPNLDQVASVGAINFKDWKWLWILVIIAVLGFGGYQVFKKD